MIPLLGSVVYRLDYRNALAHGVINEFEIVFVGLQFTGRERAEYDRYADEITDRRDRLVARYPELGRADDLFERLEELFEETQDPLIRALQASVSRRRAVLHGATARRDLVMALFSNALRESKVVLFHELIQEAEDLAAELKARGISAEAHHSNLTKEERKSVLRRFKRGATKVVVAPRTLDEGIDVPDADVGIIVAGSKRLRQRIQRAGRVLRTAPGKELSRVLVLYIAQSVEDPGARGDEFAAAISQLGRARWIEWPHEGRRLHAHLSGARFMNRK